MNELYKDQPLIQAHIINHISTLCTKYQGAPTLLSDRLCCSSPQLKCLQGWKSFCRLFPAFNFQATFKVDLPGKSIRHQNLHLTLIWAVYFTGAAGVLNISYTRCISSITLNVNNDWWDREGGGAALLARVRLIWSTIRLIVSLIMLSATVQFGLHLSLNGWSGGL